MKNNVHTHKSILIGFFLFFPQMAHGQEVDPTINIYYNLSAVLKDSSGVPTYSANVISQLEKSFDKAKISYAFKGTPWSRIIREAPTENNALIFQLIRTENREKSFHWLIPLTSSTERFRLFSRNEKKFRALTKKQIIEGAYTAVCQTLSAQCDLLKKFGFPEGRIIKIADAKAGKLELFVLRKRADFLVGYEQTERENLNLLNTRTNSLFSKYEMTSELDYLAAPNSIDPNMLTKVKAALKGFKLPEVKH